MDRRQVQGYRQPDLDRILLSRNSEQLRSRALVGCSTNVSSFCSGSLNVVSFVADYVFNKHFDIYAGLEYSKVNGGLSSGYMNTWNIDPMAGARYSF